MAFTQTWDETVPSNTIVASTYDDALHDFARDARERIIAGAAGPIASRIDFDGVFGASTTGVLYFSTDEAKLYRWNGTVWVDVTLLLLGDYILDFRDNIQQMHTNQPISPFQTQSVILPAGTMTQLSIVEVSASVRLTAGSLAVGISIVADTNSDGVFDMGIVPSVSFVFGTPPDREMFFRGYLVFSPVIAARFPFTTRQNSGGVDTVLTYITQGPDPTVRWVIAMRQTNGGSSSLIYDYLNVRVRK